jgi:hypothetical protein
MSRAATSLAVIVPLLVRLVAPLMPLPFRTVIVPELTTSPPEMAESGAPACPDVSITVMVPSFVKDHGIPGTAAP